MVLADNPHASNQKRRASRTSHAHANAEKAKWSRLLQRRFQCVSSAGFPVNTMALGCVRNTATAYQPNQNWVMVGLRLRPAKTHPLSQRKQEIGGTGSKLSAAWDMLARRCITGARI